MKIGQLYNLDSIKAFCDASTIGTRWAEFKDSAPGVVLAQNLIMINPRIFEKRYPDLTFVNSGIAFDNFGGYGRTIESLRLTDQGGFVDASDKSDNKGKISVKGENDLISVFEKQGFSEWSDTEIKQAELQNINLVSRFLEAHNKLYLQLVDQIGYLGQDTNTGLINNSYFTTSAASKPWSQMIPQELYDTVAGLITDQWNSVQNIPQYMANRVVLPIGMFNKISKAILNSAAGSFTVLKSLQDNFGGVTFTYTFRTTDVAVAFSTSDEAMVMRVPQPLTVGEIVKTGSFEFKVDSKFRIAGLDILEQKAGYILTGLGD